MGRHLITALDGYDMWSVSDKEVFLALEKYEIELELDLPHIYNENIDRIIEDGMNLDRILQEDEDE